MFASGVERPHPARIPGRGDGRASSMEIHSQALRRVFLTGPRKLIPGTN
jgi:hypothetical protein